MTEDAYEKIWYTRCPVPAASGVAYQLGLLSAAFGEHDVAVEALQDNPELIGHHFDHELLGLFREGGNIPAIAARGAGAPTRLIGLTWIEEGQSIVVRPDSGISEAADLKGSRIGVQAWADSPARSFPRGMALHGFQRALQLAGLTFDDVTIVEIPSPPSGLFNQRGQSPDGLRPDGPNVGSFLGLDRLADGQVDAVYGKGSLFAENVAQLGLVVAVDLDALPDRRFRVNNGTPRPITVHERLLAERPDIVVNFLAASLRASDWAAENPVEVREILQRETFSGPAGIEAAHGANFHLALHPELSVERLELFDIQKQFLYTYGFFKQDFDLEDWVARGPLEEARALVDASAVPA
jgi:ABC-type nitrate/sulfonate/bicarbonate transport system substrate-binding protein